MHETLGQVVGHTGWISGKLRLLSKRWQTRKSSADESSGNVATNKVPQSSSVQEHQFRPLRMMEERTKPIIMTLPSPRETAEVRYHSIVTDNAVRRIRFSPNGELLAISCGRKVTFIVKTPGMDLAPLGSEASNTAPTTENGTPLKHQAAVKDIAWSAKCHSEMRALTADTPLCRSPDNKFVVTRFANGFRVWGIVRMD
jgi:hypothetical protein